MTVDAAFAEAVEAAAAEAFFSGVVSIDGSAGPVFAMARGFAHRGLGIPTSEQTRFALASGSKTFTALGVLRLVESGLVDLADPVRPILGSDLPLIDDAVTIEQLLAHTSGIGDYLDESALGDINDFVLDVGVHTLAETAGFLPVLARRPQVFTPGERFEYCNGGYVVLALVIERVTGVGFHDWVEREVLQRAETTAAYLRSDELPGDAALGYLFDEGDRTNVLHLPVRGNGDGGAYATAGDLDRFWLALLADRIVGAHLRQAMVRPRHEIPGELLHYGLGVYVDPPTGVLAMEGHDAGVSMFSAHDPTTGTTATVLANTSEGAWPIARVLLEGIRTR